MLIGEKIKLVPLEKEDLDRTRSWANEASLNSKMLRVFPVTQMEQVKWYENAVGDSSKVLFAVKTLEDEEHVGNTGLYHIDWIHRRAEFWILIGDRDFWRQGIGQEVVSLMQRYAFNGLNLNRIYLNVGADNSQAISLYKKLNFVQEGILRQHYYVEGRYLDVITMGILRRDCDDQE